VKAKHSGQSQGISEVGSLNGKGNVLEKKRTCDEPKKPGCSTRGYAQNEGTEKRNPGSSAVGGKKVP